MHVYAIVILARRPLVVSCACVHACTAYEVVLYRESQDPSLLTLADRTVRTFFPSERFTSQSLFIVTWVDVGYYSGQYDKVGDGRIANFVDSI